MLIVPAGGWHIEGNSGRMRQKSHVMQSVAFVPFRRIAYGLPSGGVQRATVTRPVGSIREPDEKGNRMAASPALGQARHDTG